MSNENIAICPNCGCTHKIKNLQLSDVIEDNNILDVVGECTKCNNTFLITAEATDGLDVFEHGNLIYNITEIKDAEVFYINDTINPTTNQLNFN